MVTRAQRRITRRLRVKRQRAIAEVGAVGRYNGRDEERARFTHEQLKHSDKGAQEDSKNEHGIVLSAVRFVELPEQQSHDGDRCGEEEQRGDNKGVQPGVVGACFASSNPKLVPVICNI